MHLVFVIRTDPQALCDSGQVALASDCSADFMPDFQPWPYMRISECVCVRVITGFRI